MNRILENYADRLSYLRQAHAWGKWLNDNERLQVQVPLPDGTQHSIQLRAAELLEIIQSISKEERNKPAGRDLSHYRSDILNLENAIKESIRAVSDTPTFQYSAGYLDHEKHAMEWTDDWAEKFLQGELELDTRTESTADTREWYRENIAVE